jgi:formate-dependent nitrite reductase membrane component NrfD
MEFELNWGYPVIFYLFLAGLGAGCLTVSSSVLLRGGGGGFGGEHFALARVGALIAPLPVMLGCFLLIFELGSFQGGRWLRWLNLYGQINLSPMSIGTWLLTFFIFISLVYLFTFLPRDARPGDRFDALRRGLAWIAVPLGIGTAIYTGILLGAMPSRPFWNSPVLALLFLVSALSTGVAAIILGYNVIEHFRKRPLHEAFVAESRYLLTASDLLLIGFEVLAVFLFIMFAFLTVGDVKRAFTVILPGGSLSPLFWYGFVGFGLVIPALIELVYVVPKLIYHRAYTAPLIVEIVVPVIVLAGGFLLRYVVVVAGQITGPTGL